MQESPITQFKDKLKSSKQTIDLTIGEPYFKTPFIIKYNTILSLFKNRTKYSSSFGITSLRKEILKWEFKNNKLRYDLDNILITNGATSAIFLSLSTILEENDEVIVPCPYYPDYKQVIDYNKGKIVLLNTFDDNYQIDYKKLKSLVTNKTKCIIINSPNNPSGVIYNYQSLNNILRIVKENNLFLLLDNCYSEFYRLNKPISYSIFASIKDKLIICQSFSKSYSMTGWRLGYLICDSSYLKKINILHQSINVCTNTFIQYGVIQALNFNFKKRKRKYLKNLNYAYNKIIEMGLPVYKPDGAIYLFPSIKNLKIDSSSFCLGLLEKYHVAILPGVSFGTDEHIRINFLVSFRKLKLGLKRLKRYLKTLKDQ